MKTSRLKKICSVILVLALLIASMVPVYADSTSSLLVLSDECPEGYYNYVSKEIKGILTVLDSVKPDDWFSVGTPFNWGECGDIFYFPILKNGELVYLYRVYPEIDGSFSGILSEYFVAEMSRFINATSKEKPLFINCEGTQISAYLGYSDKINLTSVPEAIAEKGKPIKEMDLSSKKVVDILSESFPAENRIFGKDIINSKNSSINHPKSIPSSKSLSVSITETQGSNNWCAAYVTALIVRFKKGYNVTAFNVMNYHYSNPQPSDSLGMYGVAEYGQYWGMNPAVYHNTLSKAALVWQIANDMPVYFGMDNTSTSGSHAIALVGYSSSGDYMQIWNPWYTFKEWYTFGSTYTPTNNTSYHYVYSATIYNWQEDPGSIVSIQESY